MKAISNSSIQFTSLIPRPPPPERALISRGKPIFIASVLANIASIDTSSGTAPDLNLAKQSYLKLFEYLFYTGIGFGILLLILSPIIKKLMHGVDKELHN